MSFDLAQAVAEMLAGGCSAALLGDFDCTLGVTLALALARFADTAAAGSATAGGA